MRLPYIIRRAQHSGRLQRANVRPFLAAAIAVAGLVPANAALGGLSTKLGLWSQSSIGPAQLGVTQQVLSDFASPGGSSGTFTTYTVPSTPYQIMLAVGNLNSSQASTIGNALVSAGHADTIFRVMVEENQATWNTSWNENVFTTGAAYAAAFDNVVTKLRAVPGNSFTFAWNPNGDSNISTANAGNNINGISTVSQYPGDGFVDYIGGDTYDHYGGGLGGASELLAFAQAHGKPYIIPEWGLNGTDDTTFMSNMISFIGTSTPVVQAYFSCACSTNSDLSQFPNSRALYTAAFGSSTTTTTAAAGPPTTTSSTTPPTTIVPTSTVPVSSTTTSPVGTTTTTVVQPVPGTPGKVSATGSTPTCTAKPITIAWAMVSGAAGYDIFRDGTEVHFTDWRVSPVPSSWADSPASGKHSYQVAAYNSAGVGVRSSPVTVTVC